MSRFRNPLVFVVVTIFLTAQYSLLRDGGLSTLVKPLPILFFAAVLAFSLKRKGGKFVLLSLLAASLGDVLLDLGDAWLRAGAVVFIGSTLLLADAFNLRQKSLERRVPRAIDALIVAILFMSAAFFVAQMSAALPDTLIVGSVLMALSALLISLAATTALRDGASGDPMSSRLIAFFGACGIVSNFILYTLGLAGFTFPRDLVIQLYYWGQAAVTWSFLLPIKVTATKNPAERRGVFDG